MELRRATHFEADKRRRPKQSEEMTSADSWLAVATVLVTCNGAPSAQRPVSALRAQHRESHATHEHLPTRESEASQMRRFARIL